MATEKTTTRRTKAAVPAEATAAAVSMSPDVAALIEQNKALAEQNAALKAQMNQLTLTVIAGREAPKAGSDEKATIKVENVIGYAIAFPVTDPRTGQTRHISLQKINDTVLLRPSEVDEALEKYPHFFEKGYLSVPEVKADGVNVVRDPQAFIDGLGLNEVMGAVEKITSLPTLYLIFNYIEQARYTHLDEQGKPIVEKDDTGKVLFHKLREQNVDPKLLMVEMAVKRQIDALNETPINLDK